MNYAKAYADGYEAYADDIYATGYAIAREDYDLGKMKAKHFAAAYEQAKAAMPDKSDLYVKWFVYYSKIKGYSDEMAAIEAEWKE